MRTAAQRRCSVNLHARVGQQFPCYVTMHGAADPLRKTGGGGSYPGLALRALLQGRAPGPEVEYWVEGSFWNLCFIEMNERLSCMPGKLMKTVEEEWVLRDLVS